MHYKMVRVALGVIGLLALLVLAAPQAVDAYLGNVIINPARGNITTSFCYQVYGPLLFRSFHYWVVDSTGAIVAEGTSIQKSSDCFRVASSTHTGALTLTVKPQSVNIIDFPMYASFFVEAPPPPPPGLSVAQQDSIAPNTPWWFIRGSGFRANESVSWWLQNSLGIVANDGKVVADENGEFIVTVQRAQLYYLGDYTFAAKQGNDPTTTVKFNFSENEANAIRSSYGELAVSPPSGLVGTPFVVRASSVGGNGSYWISITGKGIVEQGQLEYMSGPLFPVSQLVIDTSRYGAGDYQVVYGTYSGEVVSVRFTVLPMLTSP